MGRDSTWRLGGERLQVGWNPFNADKFWFTGWRYVQHMRWESDGNRIIAVYIHNPEWTCSAGSHIVWRRWGRVFGNPLFVADAVIGSYGTYVQVASNSLSSSPLPLLMVKNEGGLLCLLLGWWCVTAGHCWTTKAARDDLVIAIRCAGANAENKPDIIERLNFLLGRCIDDDDCAFDDAAFNNTSFSQVSTCKNLETNCEQRPLAWGKNYTNYRRLRLLKAVCTLRNLGMLPFEG